MSDPEAESKNVPQENRPAVTKREPKRNGCGMGCLGGAITYLVLGGLFTWLILSIYSPPGSDFHSPWVKRGDWVDLAMPFPFLYLLTLPIVGLGVLIAFLIFLFKKK